MVMKFHLDFVGFRHNFGGSLHTDACVDACVQPGLPRNC